MWENKISTTLKLNNYFDSRKRGYEGVYIQKWVKTTLKELIKLLFNSKFKRTSTLNKVMAI